MRLTINQKRRVKNALRIILAGVIIGLFYPVFADGFGEVIPFINGGIIGLVGGIFIAFLELEIFDFRKRRGRFLVTLVKKIALYPLTLPLLY